MNVASILLPAVGLSLAAYALSTHMGAGFGGAEAVVVTLPAKKTDTVLPGAASGPAAKTAATTTSSVTTTGSTTAIVAPGDRAGLTRELQRELKRVGCYDGDISGSWTTSSRMAMKTFTDRVNATLPTEQPDYILLALVQKHQGKACGADCPGGQGLSEDGRCVPAAVLAKAGKTQTADTRTAEKTAAAAAVAVGAAAGAATAANSWSPTAGVANDVRSPAIRGSSSLTKSETTAAKPAPIEVPDERTRMAATNAKPDAQQEAGETREERRSRRSARQDGPVPEVGVYERPRKKRYAESKPPKVVRKFLRTMQRGLAGAW